jgi:hypothetical protein
MAGHQLGPVFAVDINKNRSIYKRLGFLLVRAPFARERGTNSTKGVEGAEVKNPSTHRPLHRGLSK